MGCFVTTSNEERSVVQSWGPFDSVIEELKYLFRLLLVLASTDPQKNKMEEKNTTKNAFIIKTTEL